MTYSIFSPLELKPSNCERLLTQCACTIAIIQDLDLLQNIQNIPLQATKNIPFYPSGNKKYTYREHIIHITGTFKSL